MSSPATRRPDFVPLIAVVHRLDRALQQDMVRAAHAHGHTGLKNSHNAVFATLGADGGRAADLAAQMGMTRQSMGEIIRELVDLDIVTMTPDPADRRAKRVTWTEHGLAVAHQGFEHIRQLEEHLSAELGAEGYAWLRQALVQITTILEDPDAGPLPEGPTV